jgi:hypothetical protein
VSSRDENKSLLAPYPTDSRLILSLYLFRKLMIASLTMP